MIVLAAVFVAAGASVIAFGIAEHVRQRRELLADLIETELAEPSSSPEHLTELMERAGALAERVIGDASAGERIRVLLTRAGWSLRPGEFVAVLGASGVGGAFVLWLFGGGSWAAGFLGLFATPAGVYAVLRRRGERRVRRVEEQLPGMLQLLAASLDAGSSVLHALELAAAEGDPPLSDEFARVVTETRVGRPVLESLESMAERVGSRDLSWTVEAIRIQHQTGGKLADTLRVLADFMRSRVEVRGEVRALSAEARLSGKILTGLPFLVGAVLFLFRRAYFAPLYTTGTGRGLLVLAAAGVVVGSVLMRRIVRVEV